MLNDGKKYELFVKDVYEILNSADGLSDVEIQHNVKLQGISRIRQVDIYWKFTKGGVPYKVVVECKDYKNPVEAEKIEAFRSALLDIGGVYGIFVSRNGFQKGAIDCARTYGIQLMEIREPLERDWEGKIKKVYITLTAAFIDRVRPSIKVDTKWAIEQGITADDLKDFGARDNEVFIINEDQDNAEPISIYSLKNMLPRDKEGIDLVYEYRYDVAYLKYKNMKLKVLKIVFKYDVYFAKEELCYDMSNLVKAIVKNVVDGTVQMIDIHRNVRKVT